jgi:LmbE family N-acetylglucosaminyl deacetylase
VDVREHAALKLAALRCHRSQVVDGWIDVLTDDDARALLGVEHYRRAAVGSPGPAFIERLTAAPARDP